MSKKVEIQKGKIIANPPTMMQNTYQERSRDDKREQHLRRSGQAMTLHKPQSRGR